MRSLIAILISVYRECVIPPLFAILEILPNYSPYKNAVIGLVLSQPAPKDIPDMMSRYFFHFFRTTPPTASEWVNTFSMYQYRSDIPTASVPPNSRIVEGHLILIIPDGESFRVGLNHLLKQKGISITFVFCSEVQGQHPIGIGRETIILVVAEWHI